MWNLKFVWHVCSHFHHIIVNGWCVRSRGTLKLSSTSSNSMPKPAEQPRGPKEVTLKGVSGLCPPLGSSERLDSIRAVSEHSPAREEVYVQPGDRSAFRLARPPDRTVPTKGSASLPGAGVLWPYLYLTLFRRLDTHFLLHWR
ncbi:unnamed protein product [Arctogadus glacialis]